MAIAIFNKIIHKHIYLISKLTNSNKDKDTRQKLHFELQAVRSFPVMMMARRTYFTLKCNTHLLFKCSNFKLYPAEIKAHLLKPFSHKKCNNYQPFVKLALAFKPTRMVFKYFLLYSEKMSIC